MDSKVNVLIKFVSACVKACRQSRMRLFSNKYSKRTYTQRQHACMLLLMKKLRMRYREVTELLEVMPDVRKVIGIDRVPHYTTLNKFFLRCGGATMSLLMVSAAKMSGMSGTIAIDATGFTTSTASRHYSMFRYKKGSGVWRDSYVKGSAAVDLWSRTVIGVRCRNDHAHDSVDFMPVLKDAAMAGDIGKVMADRGYDSERLHEFARVVLGIGTLIPVRRVRSGIVNGRFRKEMDDGFDWDGYGKRSVIEGVFSVIKRKFGDTMRSRSWEMQRKEMVLVCAAYNVYMNVISLFLRMEVFYRAV